MAETADKKFMQRALELAAMGRGMTYPNPMVGALVVKHGRVIAEGYHRKVGAAHAEIEALKGAGKKAKGGTLYVTLEPCCHTGRTGPCTDAIIKAGIAKVVVASLDPDTRVNGQGIRQLRRLGIEVRTSVCKQESILLNEAYFHHQKTGLPFVILKLAESLDGRIATGKGDSKWISGKSARAYVHRLRSEVGAVLVGGETARKDDPALTVRLVKGQNPYRILLTRSLNQPKSIQLIANNADRKTIVASSEESITRFLAGADHPELIYWSVAPSGPASLDLLDLLQKAGAFGIRSILVEGGSRVATSFFAQGLVDKLVLVIAPKLIGRGIESIGDLGIRSVDQAKQFSRSRFVSVGEDMIFEGYPKKG
ncbi:MAG: bifunctional diaminohydroxyphosphoribosylaminopyrimidine deaminase/5-amino-6-(5-phosphoribosylamino)uracil reductase RibD [bacterium]|nr:bifunctional diaminohydroxyphosphoribosylaminopyrimidine deaminase/5-amino-6-(5-phosphoribosylamino)uracil reductase RibD [bacterium]